MTTRLNIMMQIPFFDIQGARAKTFMKGFLTYFKHLILFHYWE